MLLDALDALVDQRDAVIVVGAQAVHLRTGGVDVAIPESTSDGDLALAPGLLVHDPLLEQAVRQAGFLPAVGDAIGTWTRRPWWSTARRWTSALSTLRTGGPSR